MKNKTHVFRNQSNCVYDNMYSKPPQLGDDYNAKLSVAVFIRVDLPSQIDIEKNKCLSEIKCGTFDAQYNFELCTWHILPHTNLKDVPDKYVSCWWHRPFYKSICSMYANTMKSGNLRSKEYEGNI